MTDYGYGYSIWLPVKLPRLLTNIIKDNNVAPHIPHVTLHTNMTKSKADSTLKKLGREYIVYIKNPEIVISGDIYRHDPLHSWVIPVKVSHPDLGPILLNHVPHITLKYWPNMSREEESVPVPELPCIDYEYVSRPVVADTSDIRPWSWKIL